MTEQKKVTGLASRKLAVEVLLKVEQNEAFANQALAAAFKQHSLTERDRAFVTFIVQGTLRHQIEIDDELAKFSKKPIAKLHPPLRAVLRSAIFQITQMEDMPPSAVINAAVEIARKTGHEGQSKFVNGVLRSFLRSQDPATRSRQDASGCQPGPIVSKANGVGGAERAPGPLQDSASRSDSAKAADSATGSVSAKHGSNATDPKLDSGRLRTAGGSPAHVPNQEPPAPQKLSKKYSLPQWIVERWMKRFEESEYMSLFEHSQKIPILTLRVCEESITPEGLISIFKSKGMTVERSKLHPACINIIDRGGLSGPVSKLPGYAEGLFVVQDDASALVSTVVAPEPGQTIIDLCAAPGGKSVHLGELMQNKGRVIAVDSSAKRLSLLGSERRRLGLQNIETVVMDGREYKPETLGDAVLLDAPCSGTGVLNRRSDLRQHRKESDLASLIEIQQSLLENAARMVKPGGVLVYSTCSMEPEENEENIRVFLGKHPEFKADKLERFFSQEILQDWQAEKHWSETQKALADGYIQLLPSRHGSSGFFICRLRREG